MNDKPRKLVTGPCTRQPLDCLSSFHGSGESLTTVKTLPLKGWTVLLGRLRLGEGLVSWRNRKHPRLQLQAQIDLTWGPGGRTR